MIYEVNPKLKPEGLIGISDEQIAQHWRLYEGYVANVNTLRHELESFRRQERASALHSDRRRRLGFEYNGMLLHEYYFANLKAKVVEPSGTSPLKKALTGEFGTFASFKADFCNTGATRSVGWAILYFDATTRTMNNHFVQLHEDGNVAGFVPLLVMDVWEHAYMVDHGAGRREEYIKAFFNNVNWDIVEQRFDEAAAGRLPRR